MLKSKKSYPTKQKINMVMKDKHAKTNYKALAASAAVLVAVLLTLKLTFWNTYGRLWMLEEQLEDLQAETTLMERQTADFPAMMNHYEHYVVTGAQRTYSRDAILQLVRREIMPLCAVEGMTISGDTVTLELRELSLQGVSTLVERLEKLPEIDSVDVFSVSGKGEDRPAVSMQLTMDDGREEEEESAE